MTIRERDGRKWLGLMALIPGLAIVFMDQTILPVALPAIQNELHTGAVGLEWCVNAYLLTTAMFALVGGKVSDRIGHRNGFLWGMLGFVLASALCGFSPNVQWLIGARALQGVAAALMFPSQTALLTALFPPHERGRAVGLNVSISSLFLIMGPMVGGYLTQFWSWRMIFWVNLPVALIGIPLARLFLPAPQPTKQQIDGWGFLFFAAASASLVVLFMQAPLWGWFSTLTLSMALVGVASLLLLIRRERKAAHPFLDLSLFRHPVYAAINISVSVTQFILMINVFRAIYLQSVLGFSAAETGLITFVSCMPVLFFSPIGGWLSDKISPKLPVALGFLLLISSFFWLGFFSTPPLASLLAAVIAFGMGIPLVLTPSYSQAMGSVPPKKLGVAFGMVSTLRTLSATMGVALIGLGIDTVQGRDLQKLVATSPGLPTLSNYEVAEMARGTLSMKAFPEHAEALAEVMRRAEIAGFSVMHFLLGFLLLAAFAAIFVLYQRKSAHHLPSSIAEGWD